MNTLFADAETARQYAKITSMPNDGRLLFQKMFRAMIEDRAGEIIQAQGGVVGANEEQAAIELAEQQIYEEKAPLTPEFCKIICISLGVVMEDRTLNVGSHKGEDEKTLLGSLIMGMEKFEKSRPIQYLCAFNGKEFDVPLIAKRMIRHGITPHKLFKIMGLKPWEQKFIIDPKEMWAMGKYNDRSSLALCCYVLDIPSPKDGGMDGAKVGIVYWEAVLTGDEAKIKAALNKIAFYCEGDVRALAALYLRMTNQPPLNVLPIQ